MHKLNPHIKIESIHRVYATVRVQCRSQNTQISHILEDETKAALLTCISFSLNS